MEVLITMIKIRGGKAKAKVVAFTKSPSQIVDSGNIVPTQ